MTTVRIAPSTALTTCLALCGILNGLDAARSQEQFRLTTPQASAVADAVLTADSLEVTDARGKVTVYIRDARQDSLDGRWLAYHSRSLNQIIRWPLSNSGNMQIGDKVGADWSYRVSQMVVQPQSRTANRGALPTPMQPSVQPSVQLPAQPPLQPNMQPANLASPLDAAQGGLGGDPFADVITQSLTNVVASPLFGTVQRGDPARAQMLHLATIDSRGLTRYLSRDFGQGLALSDTPRDRSDWWTAPAGNYIRIQHYQNGRVTALSASRGHALSLEPIAQDPRQLWRILPFGNDRKRFVIENAMHSGNCLTALGGQVILQPINYAPTQLWIPMVAPTLPTFQPFWKSVNQQIHANAALAPAQVTLLNSHRTSILLLVHDQRSGAVQEIRVAAGQSATVSLDRDAGSTIVESYEIRSPGGVWESQQFTTAVPPRPFYDISVYEDFLQSIAIDRTGKSPNPIEDINVVPKSVGWIIIPPGAQLPQSSSIDVYPQAKAANNPGAVRRLDPKQFDKTQTENPLEAILNEVQSLPRRGF